MRMPMYKVRAVIAEGRYTCEHCDIDKSWILSVDIGNLNHRQLKSEINRAIKRQRREVSDVSYPQPPHKLNYEVKYNIDKPVELEREDRLPSNLEKALGNG